MHNRTKSEQACMFSRLSSTSLARLTLVLDRHCDYQNTTICFIEYSDHSQSCTVLIQLQLYFQDLSQAWSMSSYFIHWLIRCQRLYSRLNPANIVGVVQTGRSSPISQAHMSALKSNIWNIDHWMKPFPWCQEKTEDCSSDRPTALRAPSGPLRCTAL